MTGEALKKEDAESELRSGVEIQDKHSEVHCCPNLTAFLSGA